jgi:hypothetical protein
VPTDMPEEVMTGVIGRAEAAAARVDAENPKANPSEETEGRLAT